MIDGRMDLIGVNDVCNMLTDADKEAKPKNAILVHASENQETCPRAENNSILIHSQLI